MFEELLRPRRRNGADAAELPRALPVLWLLGKTGAGKTSLIRALTGLDAAEIGNGFAPCTRSAMRFDHPEDAPLLRFLDTRGLGEAGYDPADDLAACSGHAHALLIVCRLDDPVQGEVAEAAAAALREDRPALLIHTGADLVPDDGARSRARHANAARIARAVGRDLPQIEVALAGDDAESSADRIIDALIEILPEAALVLERRDARDAESAAFEAQRRRILTYASAAGTSDALPVVGAVSVPAVQVAMLRELARIHEAEWTRETLAAFVGALGLGATARFGVSYGLRQLGKLIPGYGQTLGAAAAGGISFAATYALGRAASYYLFHAARGDRADPEALRAVYAKALKRSRRGTR